MKKKPFKLTIKNKFKGKNEEHPGLIWIAKNIIKKAKAEVENKSRGEL